MYIWEVAAWEIAHLGSCHLEKYPWEVAAWEKAFGKVPNIAKNNLSVQRCLSPKFALFQNVKIINAFIVNIADRSGIRKPYLKMK